MSNDHLMDRRGFVKTAGGAVAAASLVAVDPLFAQTASSRRRYAIVGTGDRATGMWGRPIRERYSDIVESIGHTPLVELKRLSPKPGVRVWAKLESANPTGSVKDRVARSLIENAEEEGLIAPGQTILEPTSGNTGISLAMICSRKGYPLKVVMPDNVTGERAQLLEMYGAEIVYSEGAKGSNGAVEVALEMADDPQYYMPYQYGNEANPRAHYDGTAVEIRMTAGCDRTTPDNEKRPGFDGAAGRVAF